MNVKKYNSNSEEIKKASKLAWDKMRPRDLVSNGVVRDRGVKFDTHDATWEIYWLIACGELGYTDPEILSYPKWRHYEYK